MKLNILFLIILGIVLANNCFAYQTVVDPVIYENNNSYLKGWIIGVSDLELIRPAFVCSATKATYPRVIYGYENQEKQIVRAFEVVSNKDLRAANCQLTLQTELETIEPEIITSRWATLRGMLASNGSQKFKITFKIWDKNEKEPKYNATAYQTGYQSNDFLITNGPIRFSFNARYFSFNKPFVPKGEYCYRAIAIDSNQKIIEAKNYQCFQSKALSRLGVDELDVYYYSQELPPWNHAPLNNGATFSADGCLNTSIAMIIRYWYDHDPVIKRNWEAMYDDCIAHNCPHSKDKAFTATGRAPNPFSAHWVATYYSGGKMDSWNKVEPWKRIGLVLKSITKNDPASIRNWYLERGVPVFFMCMPSYCSGGTRHTGVLVGFWKDGIYNDPKGQFLDHMIVNDPAKFDVANGKSRVLDVTRLSFQAGIPRCGRQAQGEFMLDPEGTAPYSEGIAAVYPVGFKMDGFTSYPNQ